MGALPLPALGDVACTPELHPPWTPVFQTPKQDVLVLVKTREAETSWLFHHPWISPKFHIKSEASEDKPMGSIFNTIAQFWRSSIPEHCLPELICTPFLSVWYVVTSAAGCCISCRFVCRVSVRVCVLDEACLIGPMPSSECARWHTSGQLEPCWVWMQRAKKMWQAQKKHWGYKISHWVKQTFWSPGPQNELSSGDGNNKNSPSIIIWLMEKGCCMFYFQNQNLLERLLFLTTIKACSSLTTQFSLSIHNYFY